MALKPTAGLTPHVGLYPSYNYPIGISTESEYDIQLGPHEIQSLYDIRLALEIQSLYDIPMVKEILSKYDIRLGPLDLQSLYDIQLALELLSKYDIQLGPLEILSKYDIQIGPLELQSLYDIRLALEILSKYDIQLGPLEIQSLYDIRLALEILSKYDIQIGPLELQSLYDIQIGALEILSKYDIQLGPLEIQSLYDIQLGALEILSKYDIQIGPLELQSLYDIQIGALEILSKYDIIIPTHPYYYLGTEITNNVFDFGDFKGLDPKLTKLLREGVKQSTLINAGYSPLAVKFLVRFTRASVEAAGAELANVNWRAAVEALDDDSLIWLGRSDRAYRAASIYILAKIPDDTLITYEHAVELTISEPWALEDPAQEWSPGEVTFPQTASTAFSNIGELAAPIDSASVTGVSIDSGGIQHLEDVALALTDGDGEATSITLADKLLSGEVVTLNRLHETLDHEYDADFDAVAAGTTRWAADAVNDGCSLSAGTIIVPQTKSFYYLFESSRVLTENIKLTAKIEVTAGSPLIQYSTDGSNWYTAVPASDIKTGRTTVYWLNNTSHQTDVYIRFYAPSGASMVVHSAVFEFSRDCRADSALEIEAGGSATASMTASGSSKGVPVIGFRSRWNP